jgi:hypothetical protein
MASRVRMRLQAQRIQVTIRQNYDRSTAMWKAVGTLSRQGCRHLAHSRHGEGPLGGYFLRTFECFGCEHSTGEVLKVSIEEGLPCTGSPILAPASRSAS